MQRRPTIFSPNVKKTVPIFCFLRGSGLSQVWPHVLAGVSYSIVVVLVHFYIVELPQFPTSFITVLGLVVGLLLVFRTSTGYDRYYEGRKLWSNLTFRIRSMASLVWVGVSETSTAEYIEKKSVINLLVAFAFATKKHLRGEYDREQDEDLYQLICHLPKIEAINSLIQSLHDEEPISIPNTNGGADASVTVENGDTTVPPVVIAEEVSKGKINKAKTKIMRVGSTFTTSSPFYRAYDCITPNNIPMEMIYHFSSILLKMLEDKRMHNETGKILLNYTHELTNCLTQLERILRTPIPLAYSIHLHQCIWLYIMSLPIQVVAQIGWLTIPGMALVCVYLLGILSIGWEIENPFGYDDNDLPLDEYCEVLWNEVRNFTFKKLPGAEEWMFTDQNRPFHPDLRQSAVQLLDLRYDKLEREVNDLLRGKARHNLLQKEEGHANLAFIPQS